MAQEFIYISSFSQYFMLLLISFSGIIAGIIVSILAPEELLQYRKYFFYIFPAIIAMILGLICWKMINIIQNPNLNYSFSILIYFAVLCLFIILATVLFYYFLNKNLAFVNLPYAIMSLSFLFTIFNFILFAEQQNILLIAISALIFCFGLFASVYIMSFSTIPKHDLFVIKKENYIFIAKLFAVFVPFVLVGILFYSLQFLFFH